MSTRLKTNGTEFSEELCFKPQRPEDLFAPLAQGAAMLLANTKRDRVRSVLHFVDTSKKGTRRWCSMQLCGNRLKVAPPMRRVADLRASKNKEQIAGCQPRFAYKAFVERPGRD